MIRIVPTILDTWCDSAEDLKTMNVALRRFDIIGLTAEQQDKIIRQFRKDSMPSNHKSRGDSFYAELPTTEYGPLLDMCEIDNHRKIVPYLTCIRSVNCTAVTLSVEFTFVYGALGKDSSAWTNGKHFHCRNLLEYVLITDYLRKTVSKCVNETNKIVAVQHKMRVTPFVDTHCDNMTESVNLDFCKSFIDMLNESLDRIAGKKSSLAVYSLWRTKPQGFEFTAKDICTAEPAWTALNPEAYIERVRQEVADAIERALHSPQI